MRALKLLVAMQEAAPRIAALLSDCEPNEALSILNRAWTWALSRGLEGEAQGRVGVEELPALFRALGWPPSSWSELHQTLAVPGGLLEPTPSGAFRLAGSAPPRDRSLPDDPEEASRLRAASTDRQRRSRARRKLREAGWVFAEGFWAPAMGGKGLRFHDELEALQHLSKEAVETPPPPRVGQLSMRVESQAARLVRRRIDHGGAPPPSFPDTGTRPSKLYRKELAREKREARSKRKLGRAQAVEEQKSRAEQEREEAQLLGVRGCYDRLIAHTPGYEKGGPAGSRADMGAVLAMRRAGYSQENIIQAWARNQALRIARVERIAQLPERIDSLTRGLLG